MAARTIRPITKVAWDNYVSVSQKTAEKLSLSDGDVVTVTSATKKDSAEKYSVELPILIQPGQHDRVISVALGYGVKGTDRFAKMGPHWLEGKPTLNEVNWLAKTQLDSSNSKRRHCNTMLIKSRLRKQANSGHWLPLKSIIH